MHLLLLVKKVGLGYLHAPVKKANVKGAMLLSCIAFSDG